MSRSIPLNEGEIDRLLKLLNYSQLAIEYWYDGCETDEATIKENAFFLEECKRLIERISDR